MLKIFNLLKPFCEDAYRQISVREYGRMVKLSPPTASSTLARLEKEGLLISAKEGIYRWYRASREHFLYQGLSRLYWQQELFSLTENFHPQVLYRKIILFGSLSKAENTHNSDVDLYVDVEKKELNTTLLEKKLHRKVQLHFKESLANQHLKQNIEHGVRIR